MRRFAGLMTATILVVGATAALAQELPPDEIVPGGSIQCEVGITDGTVVYETVEITDQTLVDRGTLCATVPPAGSPVAVHTPIVVSRWDKPWAGKGA